MRHSNRQDNAKTMQVRYRDQQIGVWQLREENKKFFLPISCAPLFFLFSFFFFSIKKFNLTPVFRDPFFPIFFSFFLFPSPFKFGVSRVPILVLYFNPTPRPRELQFVFSAKISRYLATIHISLAIQVLPIL